MFYRRGEFIQSFRIKMCPRLRICSLYLFQGNHDEMTIGRALQSRVSLYGWQEGGETAAKYGSLLCHDEVEPFICLRVIWSASRS